MTVPDGTFHVCTLVTRPEAYAAMRATFEQAGFVAPRCRFTVLDNRDGNAHDPYRSLDDAIRQTPSPEVLVFCHQDVLLDPGNGYELLSSIVDQLDLADPAWAVAGIAGGTETLRMAMCVTDPSGPWRVGELPRQVQSLDECFLLIRPRPGLACSEGLSGFHFYGTDLCLNANRLGLTCYAIPFHMTHLSAGNRDASFDECRRRVAERWNPEYIGRYVRTPSAILFLSRFGWLRRVFGSDARLAKMERPPLWHTAWVALRRLLSGQRPR